MNRSVVTGAAGFLGSHLCDRLLARGDDVVGVDSLITGASANLESALQNPRFRFVQVDVRKPFTVEGPVNEVYHLASPASPKDYDAHPIETLEAGADGTRNALELARSKEARILLASTSEVYGDPEVHPQPETYWGRVNPVGPRSVYDEAKRYAEAYATAHARVHDTQVRIARIFNTYGPRMRAHDGRAIPNFLAQIAAKKPLTVYGNGKQTRSFCYVDDLLSGFERLMERGDSSPVNLGNPAETTILEIAQLLKRITGCDSPIVFEPLPKDDPRQRRPDITRAKALLGWEPRIALYEGLRRTLSSQKIPIVSR